MQTDKYYWNNRRKENRQKAIAYLGERCASCNTTDNLEFDHIDRINMSFRISQRLQYSWNSILPELEKCQLLCKSCHLDKSYKEMLEIGKYRKKQGMKHGYPSTYNNHKCRCIECRKAWAAYCRGR